MRYLILFCVIIASFAPLKAQNEVYLCVQPGDLGIGLRYDRDFDKGGIYISAVHGSYRISDDCYIKNHLKLAMGYKVAAKSDIHQYLTIGLTYHSYRNIVDEYGTFRHRGLSPFSFEIGAMGRVKIFSLAFTMDILKWEGCIGLGVSF